MRCSSPFRRSLKDGREYIFRCGHCLSCRISRRSIWTIRMLHELESYQNSVFVTLTYSDECLPARNGVGILVKNDLQLFFKRLRKSLSSKLKFFGCGEYGEKFGRPHFHAIIFGCIESEDLHLAWKLGRMDVGVAEAASIRYVAGYVSKKLGLSGSLNHDRPAEFCVSSQGIGLDWARANMYESLLNGYLTFKGRKIGIPRAYVDLYREIFPEGAEGFEFRRSFEADLALSNKILELCPQYGGRSYNELSDVERDDLIIQFARAGELINSDLEAQNRLREGKL